MLKKTIEYVDYSGNSRKEDFYFNITKAEVTEMEMSVTGGLVEKINRIIAEQDGKEIIALFKDIIMKAYGIKSPDGRRFQKSEEISLEFSQTEAYNVLFIELVTNADAAANFINAILPADAIKAAG